MDNINVYINQVIQLGVNFAPKLFLALIVSRFWMANKTTDLMAKVLQKLNTQHVELQTFLELIVSIGFKKFDDHFIKISMSLGTPPKKYWTAISKVNEAVIQAFQDHNIKVVYPTGISFGEFGQKAVEIS